MTVEPNDRCSADENRVVDGREAKLGKSPCELAFECLLSLPLERIRRC